MNSLGHTGRLYHLQIQLGSMIASMDSTTPQDPMWPSIFEFIPGSPDNVIIDFPPDETRRVVQYKVTLGNNITFHHDWIYFDEDIVYQGGRPINRTEHTYVNPHGEFLKENYPKDLDIKLRSILRPQWPWILGHCFLMGDISPSISNVRLLALLYTLDTFGDPEGHLREFSVPTFTDKFTLESSTLENWLKLMYPVVASFGSRFHTPTSLVKDQYGHLLSECRPRDGHSDILR